MICKKCNHEISDAAAFCPLCGEAVRPAGQRASRYCPACGNALGESDMFCKHCGKNFGNPKAHATAKTATTYIISAVNAIICLIIRLSTQSTFYSWSNLVENRKLVGIDSDLKPFLTLLPAASAIIVTLMIVSDTKSSTQKKASAFIINGVFIVLALLFIWFDLPFAIFDF